MDIRDLINRLDSITEEQDLTDFDTQRALSNKGQLPPNSPNVDSWYNNDEDDAAQSQQMRSTNDRVIFNKKQQHLYSLLKQLRELVGTAQFEESKISISEQLIESFGYEYLTEADLENLSDKQKFKLGDWFKTQSTSKIVKSLPKVKAMWEIYQALLAIRDELRNQPKGMSYGELSKRVTLIIGKALREIGLFWVGATMAAIALSGFAFTGIGAFIPIIGGIIAGSVVEAQFGKDVDKLIKSVVDKIWESVGNTISDITGDSEPTLNPDTTDQGAQRRSLNYDEEVARIQQALNAKGANIRVDGILGPETYRAFDQYGDQLEESVSVAESIRYLQNLLVLIENDNEVNSFNSEYAFNEAGDINAGKKKFIAKYPDLAKKLGVTITPLEPEALPPVAPTAPATPTAPVAPTAPPADTTKTTPQTTDKTIGGAAKVSPVPSKPVQEPRKVQPDTRTQEPVGPGVGAAPFAKLDAKSRLDAMTLVKQIKLAMQDMQRVPTSVQGDARKAIDHAQKTLQSYAPEMV